VRVVVEDDVYPTRAGVERGVGEGGESVFEVWEMRWDVGWGSECV